MATNLLWFVLAGFLLGFATSTLWEWFYFRRERLKLTDRRIHELEAKLREAEADTASISPVPPTAQNTVPTVAAVTREAPRTTAWGDASYRSPGVFLESEEYEEDVDQEEIFAPNRGAGGAAPPVIPTVNSVAQAAAGKPSPTPASTPLLPNNPHAAKPPPENPAAADSKRAEPRTPADALKAKRAGGPRSRQELLAALRRNSEAMQRGEFPPPEDQTTGDAPGTTSGKSSRSTLVSPNEPEPETPAQPALSPARRRWINDPRLTTRSSEYPDDLSKIKGIGDVYKQRLYRAGIYTWKQIAEADGETLRRATSAYPSSNVEEWGPQAEKLMKRFGREQAVYSGPQPDDMTKILGIGPVGASTLYRAGVCTYEQLASLPRAELEALFPIAVAGDVPDFDQWVERAAALADEKHREQ